MNQLIRKYNVPVPRYTSYPTVPMWENPETLEISWTNIVKRIFDESNNEKGISLYLHLPFCESLCTYCGCSQHITINHTVEEKYIDCLLNEWQSWLDRFQAQPNIREIHLGGGTPTFFSPENLELLLSKIINSGNNKFEKEYSFEGHPNNTAYDHLKVLHGLGFSRVSFGVQDFDLKIQEIINRIQPYENVVKATQQAREIGYKSVNFDLVYGLPLQTEEIVENTFRKVLSLRPDRIAYYSYAHVPWKRPGQRRYTEEDLPDNELKRRLYDIGKDMLIDAGYVEIGMDHFALPEDELTAAFKNGRLHRNFMGYTVTNTDLLLGLGASSISDAKYAYAQNKKKVKEYQDAILNDTPKLTNGHILNSEDLTIKEFIKELICSGQAKDHHNILDLLPNKNQDKLNVMIEEGIVEINDNMVAVTKKGKPFIRNICNIFDLRHWRSQEVHRRYSKAI